MQGLTETIAHFIAGNEVRDFPPDAIEKSKKVLVDTFACILAGAGSEVAEVAAGVADSTAGVKSGIRWARTVTASYERGASEVLGRDARPQHVLGAAARRR